MHTEGFWTITGQLDLWTVSNQSSKNITSQDDQQKSGDEDYPSTLYNIIYIISIFQKKSCL